MLAAAPLLLPALDSDVLAATQEPAGGSLAATAEALTAFVQTQYAKHLTEQQLKLLQRRIELGLRSAQRLSMGLPFTS